MASNSQGLRIGIQVALALVILALGYWLYLSITEPYQVIERAREVTEQTRERMDDVRQALVVYERENDQFPGSLDSLVMWVEQDSLMRARRDSLFGEQLSLDSLIYSPRTGKRFIYTLNDTGRVAIYLLKDPDSEDQIGSAQPDVTMLNAASWE